MFTDVGDGLSPKQQFGYLVQKLHDNPDKPDVETRKSQATLLIEAYFSETGRIPASHSLERLADYLLIDVLTDRLKRQRGDEYPILSGMQRTRRAHNEIPNSEDPRLG